MDFAPAHAPAPDTSSEALQLAEILDLKAATPLVNELLARRGGDLQIDASRVQRLGGQCLQAVLSAVATWNADGARLEILSPSKDFIEGLELLGVLRAEPQEQAA